MMTTRPSDLRVGPIRLFPSRRWAIAIGALCLLMTAMAAGQAAKDQPSVRSRKLVLFDGTSLDGWKKTDFAHAGDVKVEDGKIIMSTGSSMTGITSTRRDLPRT